MTDIGHDTPGAAASHLQEAVTGVDRRTLDALFRHPLAHNLSWREVVNLFIATGGAEEKHNGEFEFRAGDETLTLKKPHNKDLTGPDVLDLRRLLQRAGWSPNGAGPQSFAPATADPSLIVVIDHAGAKVYRVDRSIDGAEGVAAYDPKHLMHHLERKMHDEDRAETYPDDERFFEQVADAVSTGGQIVVIGHGKGQSNEADHLSAYLKARHKGTYARIVREIVADLPHLTTPQLLDLGRRAFAED